MSEQLRNREADDSRRRDVRQNPAGCLAHRAHHGATVEPHTDRTGDDPEDQRQRDQEWLCGPAHLLSMIAPADRFNAGRPKRALVRTAAGLLTKLGWA